MEFGLIPHQSSDGMVELAVKAEQLGYASIFLGHHRFTPTFTSQMHPVVQLSAIAARTERIRLGTSVHLLPTDHPLDVAEEFASLDVLSNGRVIYGPGIGYHAYEYEAVDLPYHQRGARMSESLEVLQRVWEEVNVSHHGTFFDFDDVTLTPRPVQQPRPPIWVGANSRAGAARAATLADGWIVGFADRLPKLAPKVADYRALADANGRQHTVCLMRLVGIGPTREYVETEWLPAVLTMLRGYSKVGAPAEKDDAQADTMRRARRDQASLADLGDDVFVAGTPDDCIASVRRCQEETGCEHFVSSFDGSDPDAAMELFAREVMPAFA